MLVFTRHVNESIICTLPSGEKITFLIVANRERGKVRVGIEAPKSVSVHREEIQKRIEGENGTQR